MEADGLLPERKILEFAFVAANHRIRRVLGVDQVLRVKRLNLADGQPFAVVTVWCPAELGQHLSRHDVERSPFYELLTTPLGGATQTIGADAAEVGDAALLGVPAGSPVLRCDRVTMDESGRAGARQRARLPRPPHRVRGGSPARRTVDRAERVAPGRLTNTGRTSPRSTRGRQSLGSLPALPRGGAVVADTEEPERWERI